MFLLNLQYSGAQITPIQSDYENMSGNVSFKEFLHQYNELKRWLEQMQSISCSGQEVSSYCEKYTNQIFYEEILKRSPRRELLNEYACHLVKYHPHLKKDVLYKLNYLNNRWKMIEFSIISKQLYNENITRDLEQDLKNFELWLVGIESMVKKLSLDPNWSLGEIEKHLTDHKVMINSNSFKVYFQVIFNFILMFYGSVYNLILKPMLVLSTPFLS